jgi:hypothetical protein
VDSFFVALSDIDEHEDPEIGVVRLFFGVTIEGDAEGTGIELMEQFME